MTHVVVVGGGLAGAKTAEALRENGFDGDITIAAAEDRLPYERPPLSKSYLISQEGLDEAIVHLQSWYDDQNITLRLGTTVIGIDTGAKTVTLDGGGELAYDQLVLATGASPRALPVPGGDLPGVLTLRTVADSDALREGLTEGKRAVIVGGGWIGLEVAAGARQRGAEVTVLEGLELPLFRVLGRELATYFADLHRRNGVDLRTSAKVESVISTDGRATGVRLADGTEVLGDLVLAAVGAAPTTALAEAAGLSVDNGIVCDSGGRTSNADIFAVGDVSRWDHPFLGHPIRVEHWANALNQPTRVAAAMMNRELGTAELPFFFTDQYDLGLEYIGEHTDDDTLVMREVGDGERVAFWTRDGVLVAGMAINVWDQVDPLKALILQKAQIDPVRLADPAIEIADLGSN